MFVGGTEVGVGVEPEAVEAECAYSALRVPLQVVDAADECDRPNTVRGTDVSREVRL